jgi:hypothetical protein
VIDRLEVDSQLAEIQARRVALFDQQRSATYPEAEFYERLRRLDSEERYWRSRLLESDNPAPAGIPQWGDNLWKTVLGLQADVISWREERRAERLADAIERDKARRIYYALFTLVVVMAGLDAIARVWGA